MAAVSRCAAPARPTGGSSWSAAAAGKLGRARTAGACRQPRRRRRWGACRHEEYAARFETLRRGRGLAGGPPGSRRPRSRRRGARARADHRGGRWVALAAKMSSLLARSAASHIWVSFATLASRSQAALSTRNHSGPRGPARSGVAGSCCCAARRSVPGGSSGRGGAGWAAGRGGRQRSRPRPPPGSAGSARCGCRGGGRVRRRGSRAGRAASPTTPALRDEPFVRGHGVGSEPGQNRLCPAQRHVGPGVVARPPVSGQHGVSQLLDERARRVLVSPPRVEQARPAEPVARMVGSARASGRGPSLRVRGRTLLNAALPRPQHRLWDSAPSRRRTQRACPRPPRRAPGVRARVSPSLKVPPRAPVLTARTRRRDRRFRSRSRSRSRSRRPAARPVPPDVNRAAAAVRARPARGWAGAPARAGPGRGGSAARPAAARR